MAHLHDFIGDLALILITAGIATILFKWLKQPVVLGYIVTGFIAGPHITWLPTVADMGNVEIWAEIGVIFLLFALGLEFSFKKLMEVGGTASLATIINMGSMIVIGYIVGQLLNWSPMDSIFLGGMLSMSSTTIIIKAFNDMQLQKQKFAGIVFGMLIVEDLAAILMMVLLSTVAVSHKIEGVELLNSLLRLIFFVLVWFIVGIYLIPTMLKKLKTYLNDETLIIVSIGLCLGMVLFASKVGFSAALGAFIMGSILAETVKARHIEHLVEPIKNLFGAVFFVSVGMMLDPEVVKEYWLLILILTGVVLIGRVIFATLGVLASGEGLKVAMQSGFSLAQIGEFSFIIATLGMSLGVISANLYPIIVSVSIITTFTTPYFIKLSTPLYEQIEPHIPVKWSKIIEGYAASGLKTVNKQNDWNKLLKSILQLTAIYSTIVLAIIFTFEQFVTPFITDKISGIWGRVLTATLALLLMAPFLRAIIMKKNRSIEFRNLWDDNHFNRGALISLIVFRLGICCALIMMVLVPLFPHYTLQMIVISMAVIAFVIYFRGFKSQSRRMEARFLENLHQKQLFEEKSAPIHPLVANALLLKDIHLEEIDISPSSPKVGKTLKELNLRKNLGLNVVTIIRGNRKINIPDANEHIYPFDKLIVSGSDEDIQRFTKMVEDRKETLLANEESSHHIILSQYVVEETSPLIGKTIQELDLQRKTECMIINIERDDHSIIAISPTCTLQKGDTLLLAGEREKIHNFEANLSL
ncbi:CPA2 family monovalent cation:H+ antiporter-2 [Parabacteroides sp. PF5-5]|uniref:cation:proton antiporter n=1 Tax=unclassified Parabacteroides TaxID=2649774 RepID=UPI0024752112|nr:MULTISPECIES: cation:proton antiporter [unclassified Parabacteroides]MDH6304110.1 CPA2 family monovalent cation:H+ antiporter-2 [Parabacteroides sp. PH5-39]MDH6315190.1 CPA2 family monovalent cation:H+ antiporter-2 [Parabacteroides sp. PF5-13]MDH6318835.1 CPA2 family monovalent cation:H+ antiporter-2 [Parabacteroides sp. PH5-13]MDH6322564.1 CPA2 family monovalent cation:H+ antiporter-2 [Parabacteroides sp. PH5-8]MDH6326284.1 CPA2 family monovalent cation:H+ antiporter-2 [Parabacteroides sp.